LFNSILNEKFELLLQDLPAFHHKQLSEIPFFEIIKEFTHMVKGELHDPSPVSSRYFNALPADKINIIRQTEKKEVTFH
jgi:hypothetical protein